MEMSESGAPPPEEDFSLIPLVDRSTHKNWKARLSAYSEAIAKFQATASDDDPYFRPYIRDSELMRKWVTDSNVVAQEKGVEAVCVLLGQAGETAAGLRPDVMPAMVDKCFGAMRQGTKTRASEAALLFIEIENTGEGVVLDVLKGLDAKQPKIVAQSVKCLGEIVSAFGVKPLSKLQPLLKSLVKIFAHTDKTVRAEGTALAQALHLYLGPALTPALADLKEIQRDQLSHAFEAMEANGQAGGLGRPSRFTRREQAQREAAEATGTAGQDVADEPEPEADPLEFVEAVDPIKLLPADFLNVIASTKWKDKADLCEASLKALEANPLLVDHPDLGAYAAALGKRMSDTNVNVVASAAKVIGALAAGVQNKGFGKYRGSVVPPMLERLKEKKKNVTEAIGNALDVVAKTTTFNDLAEDCMTALGNKNPQVREGTLSFIARSLSMTKQAPDKAVMQSIVPAQIVALGDADATVRTAAADGIGCFMRIFGDRALNPFLEGVTSQQRDKVAQAAAKATVGCKAGGPAPAQVRALAPSVGADNRPPPAKAPASTAAKAPAKAAESRPAAVKPMPARLAAKAAIPASVSGSSTSSAASSVSKGAQAGLSKPATNAASQKPQQILSAAASDPVRYKYSQEDAEAQAAGILPGPIQTELGSAQWKERLTAMESLVAWLEDGAAESTEPELLVRSFAKTPSWNEKNFQVCNLVYRALAISAEKNASFGRSAAALAIPALTEKLGDLKSKKPAGETLVVFAERTSLAFVLAQCYDPLGKQKAPRAQADALTWIKQALIDFGIVGISLKELVNFVKTNLQSSNAQVRSSATSVLVTLRLFVGSAVDGFIEDLNSQLKATIVSEFAKVEGQNPPEPSKTSTEIREGAASSNTAQSSAINPLDDLVTRVDLDKLVAQTTAVAGASSADWKVRKEGLENLLALLEVKSHSRLKSNMGDIGPVLKARCADTNLAVKNLDLTIIAKIATGMGPPFERHARPLAAAVAGVTADQKATTRAAAVTCLQAMSEACGGLDSVVAGLTTGLESTNPALRSTVLGFIGADFAAREPSSSIDLSGLIMPVLTSLEDRNGDVRKAAQAVLPFVVARAGYNQVANQTSSLKAASRATVMPLLEAARDAAAAQKKSLAAAKGPAVAKASAPAAPARSAPIASSSSAAVPAARNESVPRGLAGARGMSLKSTIRDPAAAARPTYDEVKASRPTGRLDAIKAIGQSAPAIHSSSGSGEQPPFSLIDHELKLARGRRDGSKWASDTATSQSLLELLHKQMDTAASPELVARLFSVDRSAEKDHMVGLSMMEEFYNVHTDASRYDLLDDNLLRDVRLENLDLPIKYASARMRDGSTQMVLKCLDLLQNIVEVVDQTAGNGFSDADSQILIPALIGKLGDNKYKDKLAGIFFMIDRTVAGSKVVLYYQDHGITSASAKTRAASMEMLAQLFKKRGDMVTTSSDGGKLWKRIGAFIKSPDSATRSAALDCMAYLYKVHGDVIYQVLGDLPPRDRDLLDKRIATLGLGSSTRPSGIPVHVKQSPQRAANGRSSPAPPRSAPPSTQSSPRSETSAARPASRMQEPLVVENANGRRETAETPSPPAALPRPRSRPSAESMSSTIGNILTADSDKSVEALKKVQRVLEVSPEDVQGSVQELIEAVHSQLQRIFLAPDALEDPKVFRLTKHLVQTMSNFCDHQTLVEQVDPDNMMILLEQLTVGLLRTDMASADSPIKEMSRYMNMTILRLFATGRRGTIFSALFALLLQLTRGLTADTPKDSMVISHAELILKCIWKRSRSAEEDFKRQLLDARELMRTIESFMVDIPPQDWRQRAADQVPLGDMPLRTIKVLIQHIVSTYGNDHSYNLLAEAFPVSPASTHIYAYIYRLLATAPPAEQTAHAGSSSGVAVPRGERAPPIAVPALESQTIQPAPDKATDGEPEPADQLEEELLSLIDVIQPKHGGAGKLDEGMPALHAFLKEHPDKNPFFEAILNARLGQSSYKMFLKRKLHNMSKDHGRASNTKTASPPASPARPGPAITSNSQSAVPSTAGTSDAQTNARLEQLKNKFKSMHPTGP